MEQQPHQDLIEVIDAYCERHGISPSAFGIKMMRDPRFVFDLKKGRELRRSTEAALREKMRAEPTARPA